MAAALQPDGRLIVAGLFEVFHGQFLQSLARLDPQGSVDPTFAPKPGVDGVVNTVALEGDGDIVVGGYFSQVNGQTRHALARFHSDGSLDTGFEPVLLGSDGAHVQVVRVQPDGKILVGGNFRTVDGESRSCIARLHPNGNVDTTFDPGEAVEDVFGVVYDLAMRSDGSVIIGGLFTKFDGLQRYGLAQLRPDGQVDAAFEPSLEYTRGLPYVSVLRFQADGRLLAAGRFDRVDSEVVETLARLNPDARLDASFRVDPGFDNPDDAPVHDLAVESAGSLLVVGDFAAIGEVQRRGLARLTSDGKLDTTFDPGEGLDWTVDRHGWANRLVLDSQARAIVVGRFVSADRVPRHQLARWWPDGRVDAGYSFPNLKPERAGTVRAVCVQPDGRWLVGGQFERVNGVARESLARFLVDGSLDTSFNADLSSGAIVSSLARQSDGKLLIGGLFDSARSVPSRNLARVDRVGRPDPSFDMRDGPDGEVFTLAVQADGAVLLAGDFVTVNQEPRYRFARIDGQGVVDPGFQVSLDYAGDVPDVFSILVQPDQAILIGGYFDRVNGEPRGNLTRLKPDGTLDNSFDPRLEIGGDLPLVVSMAQQSDGRLVVGGTFDWVNATIRQGIARLEPDGVLDLSFDPDGGVTGADPSTVYAIVIQPGGQIVIAGEFLQAASAERANLARLQPEGSLDESFRAGGIVNNWILAAALLDDGSLLLGGTFTTIDSELHLGLAHFGNALPSLPRLSIRCEGDEVVVSWEGEGTLQCSPTPLGPWQPVPKAVKPHRLPANTDGQFFRLMVP